MLVAYFSLAGEQYNVGVVEEGNTSIIAHMIAEQTGAGLFEIKPETPYPTTYQGLLDVIRQEMDNNARPEIADTVDDMDAYDTIFIGYPIWWHTAPMIIGTFLESYDLSGKEIYPFSQSASMDTEQFANSMDFVRTSAKNAAVHDELFAEASDTDGILAYLTENGFAE